MKYFWLSFFIFVVAQTVVAQTVVAQTVVAQTVVAKVFIVVSKSNTSVLDKKDVVKILKAEQLNWNDGKPVLLLMNNIESVESRKIDRITNMSKSQFVDHWRIKFFSGRALIPKQIKNPSVAVSILSENKNGIYISIDENLSKDFTDNMDLRTFTLTY